MVIVVIICVVAMFAGCAGGTDTPEPSQAPDNGMTPDSTYELIVGAFDGDEVDGIGNKAVFATPGLHIMADGYYISIAGGNSDDDAVRAVLKEAGTLAVQHLKENLG